MILPSVLFVDDDPNFIKALKRAFAREEWRLAFAESGAEALKIFADDGPFDVVVADQRMPHMSGVELLKTVRRLHPASVRVILSGYADIDQVLDAINEGHIYKFLMKDITEEALRETICDVVSAITLARENRRLLASMEAARLESEAVSRLVDDIGEMDFDPMRESALGAALEALPAGAVISSGDGILRYANREAQRLLALEAGAIQEGMTKLAPLLDLHDDLVVSSAPLVGVGELFGTVWLLMPKG